MLQNKNWLVFHITNKFPNIGNILHSLKHKTNNFKEHSEPLKQIRNNIYRDSPYHIMAHFRSNFQDTETIFAAHLTGVSQPGWRNHKKYIKIHIFIAWGLVWQVDGMLRLWHRQS